MFSGRPLVLIFLEVHKTACAPFRVYVVDAVWHGCSVRAADVHGAVYNRSDLFHFARFGEDGAGVVWECRSNAVCLRLNIVLLVVSTALWARQSRYISVYGYIKVTAVRVCV